MRFLVTPVGSSGDVHPLLGIGARLRARGHEVIVVTSEPFRRAAEASGLHFVSGFSREQYEESTQHPDLWHPTRGLKVIFSLAAEHLRYSHTLLEEIYEPGMVLVGHTLSLASRILEDRVRARGRPIPAATLHLAPSTIRTSHGPLYFRPGMNLGLLPSWLRRAFWRVADRLVFDRHLAPAVNALREDLGLPPVQSIFGSYLHSPQRVIGLFPEWFGPPRRDWPEQVRLTGFPLFDEAGQHDPNPHLEAFLAAGSAPIAFTAGSANRQAPDFFRTAVEATRLLGHRALLLTVYAEQLPSPLPPEVLHVPYAPFSELLPRCAALVHHGGIGTCAQGLAAGIPQLVRPMAFDQPDNAARLVRLGVGRWIAVPKLTSGRMAESLRFLLDSAEVAEACARWRQAIGASQPVERTCDLLEELADR